MKHRKATASGLLSATALAWTLAAGGCVRLGNAERLPTAFSNGAFARVDLPVPTPSATPAPIPVPEPEPVARPLSAHDPAFAKAMEALRDDIRNLREDIAAVHAGVAAHGANTNALSDQARTQRRIFADTLTGIGDVLGRVEILLNDLPTQQLQYTLAQLQTISAEIHILYDQIGADNTQLKNTIRQLENVVTELKDEHDEVDGWSILQIAAALVTIFAAFYTVRAAQTQRNANRRLDASARYQEYLNAIELAQTQGNQTHRDILAGLSVKKRVGHFPDELPYVTNRIETAQHQVIILTPFHVFGLLEYPRRWRDFHTTMHDQFEQTGDDRQFVVLTGTPEQRAQLIRAYVDGFDVKTFARNPLWRRDVRDALGEKAREMFDDVVDSFTRRRVLGWRTGRLTAAFFERPPEGQSARNLRQGFLNRTHRDLTRLVEKRIGFKWWDDVEWPRIERFGGKLARTFTAYTRPGKYEEKTLQKYRERLAEVLIEEDRRHFIQIGPVWANLIKAEIKDEKLSEEMLIFIDGMEVVACRQKPGEKEHRKNAVTSMIGVRNTLDAESRLKKVLVFAEEQSRMEPTTKDRVESRYASLKEESEQAAVLARQNRLTRKL